jgi:sigma-B regulation protein RsbU (phosphoserine phosphatase)
LGLLLADVSGKGMPAALLGTSLLTSIRAHAVGLGVHSGEVLAKANCLLYGTTTAERFATVFYGVYDPLASVLTFANAGHYPPMLVRDRVCIRLDNLTPPLGMLPSLPALESRAELRSGAWLIIFSDGIPEAANERGAEFGDDGLLNAILRLRTKRQRKCAVASSRKCVITHGNAASPTTSA